MGRFSVSAGRGRRLRGGWEAGAHRRPRIGGKVAAQGACRRTSRRRKAHSEIAFVLLAMVNSVLSRILPSEGTASLGYPIIQQQATNAEMIINLKTAKMLSITLKRRPLLGRAGSCVILALLA